MNPTTAAAAETMTSHSDRDTIPAPPWHLLCSECRGVVEHVELGPHRPDVVGYKHAAPVCAAWREHRAVIVERSAFDGPAICGVLRADGAPCTLDPRHLGKRHSYCGSEFEPREETSGKAT